MSVKHQRIASIIKKNVSEMLAFEISDPEIGFVTVTDVEVTNDMSFAYIYVTFLSQPQNVDRKMAALKNAKGHIRSALSKQLSIRKCPEIIFRYDDSLERANRIENIIKNLND